MQQSKSRSHAHIPSRLLETIAAEFDAASRARVCDLFNKFLQRESYSRRFAMELLDVAKGKAGDEWEVRRLAALMLEHQILKIPVEEISEFDSLFVELNLKPVETNGRINADVLKEGYTATDLRSFVAEFRRRLERLNRIHNRVKGRRSSKSALADFLNLARCESKLTVARYLFQPDEVVDRILKQVRTTRGLVDINRLQFDCARAEAERTMKGLPRFEASILERLRQASRIYWVRDETSSEINSLVEYPLTTVVLVIKLPGSDMEFEIKRAGRRGDNALSAVHRRNGSEVPPSHRFDGGSTQWMLRHESNMVSKLSSIYRFVHAAEAPVSKFISRSSIYNVPANGGEETILNYFTDARVFGRGFGEMRAAMKASVDSFSSENQSDPMGIPGDLGLTMQFLAHVGPTQAIFCGTSSFRLDRLAAYLSSKGPETYFTEGLNIEYSNQDAKRLADEVLEEALCVYSPPRVRYRSYKQYVEAALSVTENRERADRNFLSVMRQMGVFYGTLLALRASTSGESFVPRNVGLRSVWDEGEWKIKTIFMDHDNLSIYDPTRGNYNSLGAHIGTSLDELYIWGVWSGKRYVVGAVDSLEMIYRVGKGTFKQGEEQFNRAMEDAYKKTHRALSTSPELQQLFHKSFVERIHDWDTIVREYLEVKNDSIDIEAWKEDVLGRFTRQGCEKNIILEHLVAVERFADFLEKYAFLYRSHSVVA